MGKLTHGKARKTPMPWTTTTAEPPRPTFAPCPSCGALVLLRSWMTPPRAEGYWKEYVLPLMPVEGYEHRCPHDVP